MFAMTDAISIERIQDAIIELRGMQVLLDSQVASIYGVETRDVNQAVSNNAAKFPDSYRFELTAAEKRQLVENFHQFNNMKHSPYLPKAFTERGLYMLATILKGKRAREATFLIIETFAKLRELTSTIDAMSYEEDEQALQPLLEKGEKLVAEVLGDHLPTSSSETSFEINFAVLKLRHKVTRERG